jgi:hypothetical protein
MRRRGTETPQGGQQALSSSSTIQRQDQTPRGQRCIYIESAERTLGQSLISLSVCPLVGSIFVWSNSETQRWCTRRLRAELDYLGLKSFRRGSELIQVSFQLVQSIGSKGEGHLLPAIFRDTPKRAGILCNVGSLVTIFSPDRLFRLATLMYLLDHKRSYPNLAQREVSHQFQEVLVDEHLD